MENIPPEELEKRLHDDDKDEVLIDVRTPGEFRGSHMEGAKNIPLDDIKEAAKRLKKIGTVYIACGTGARSQQACKILEEDGVNVVNIKGGLRAWVREGFTTEGTGRNVIPVIRQVMIVAGTLVLAGVILGLLISPYWYALSGFVGAGLLFAGLTGICTMSWALSKMPWNK